MSNKALICIAMLALSSIVVCGQVPDRSTVIFHDAYFENGSHQDNLSLYHNRMTNVSWPSGFKSRFRNISFHMGTDRGDSELMNVELDIFSGRPNPQWNLTGLEGEEFIAQFRSLPEAGEEALPYVNLGYRGFIIRDDEGVLEGYDRISVSNGIVLAQKGNFSRGLIDTGRAMELWLLKTGKDDLDEDLYSRILSEID